LVPAAPRCRLDSAATLHGHTTVPDGRRAETSIGRETTESEQRRAAEAHVVGAAALTRSRTRASRRQSSRTTASERKSRSPRILLNTSLGPMMLATHTFNGACSCHCCYTL